MATSAPPQAAKAQSKYGAFIKKVHDATGLDTGVLTAWATIENGPVDNPLNIMGQTSHNTQYLRRYGTEQQAADATINLLRTNGSYAPILRAASTGNAGEQLKAIVASPWDKTHYSGGSWIPGASLLGVYNGFYGGVTYVGNQSPSNLLSGLDPSTYIGQAESWIASTALRGLLYVVFTGAALGLIYVALKRATTAAPGPTGYAKSKFARPAGEGIPF